MVGKYINQPKGNLDIWPVIAISMYSIYVIIWMQAYLRSYNLDYMMIYNYSMQYLLSVLASVCEYCKGLDTIQQQLFGHRGDFIKPTYSYVYS